MIRKGVVIVFACLMAASMFAPFVAGTPATSQAATDGSLSQSLSTQPHVDPAPVDQSLQDANGTVEVVVRAEEFEVPNAAASAASDGGIVEDLKSHAEETQAPIVDWAQSTDGVEVLNQFWLANAVLLELDSNAVDVREIAALDGVTGVHANFEVETPEPADDGASSGEYNTTYGLDQVNATEVWGEYDTKGAGAKVAVLDTGVDPDHPDIDIADENWAEFDENGNKVSDSEPHDTDEHGTHTSGTVAGGNASGEYIGVAPEAELMHGLVIPGGSGSFARIIGGMEWAVDENADIISMSLGASGEYIPDFIEPVRNAEEAGAIVVAASGNGYEGSSGSPGNVYDSFTIGASTVNGDIASFSSGEVVNTDRAWGEDAPADWPDTYVVPDVAAPGVNVKSSVPGGEYDTLSGTSMATPHVAGVVALMLSASADDLNVDDIKDTLEETAWKPPGEPDEQDIRYGHGIVDAKLAVDRVAAERGVTGTVTDVDGNPIEGATVSIDGGYTTVTDESGEYTLRGQEEEFNFSVDAFGYEGASASVEVTNDSFVTEDLTLQDELAVEVTQAQPGTVQSGENVSVTVDTANVDQLTVDLVGDYSEANASLFVDGNSAEFGEPFEFAGPDHTEVTVTVETTAGATGNVSLEQTYEGLDDVESITTGPTGVFNDEIDVAVVDTPDAEYNAVLADDLEAVLPGKYNISLVSTDEVLDVVDQYDTFVVHKFGEDRELTREFVDATEDSDVGVVYLDQYDEAGDWTNSIYELSKATGNPDRTDQKYGITYSPTVFTATADHPILDGLAEPGETVELYDVVTGDHTWFHGFNGQVIADVGWKGQEMSGHGLAVDGLRQSVYASALGRTLLIGGYFDYTDEANQVLANSVKHVSSDSPVSVRSDQPEQVAPGEAVTATFNVTDLEEIQVGLAEGHSTLTEDDLTLYVNGNIASFDQGLAYDDLTSDNFTVTVQPETDAVGTVALEHELVADGETVSGNTGPTSMYESPIRVPEDVDTIQEAVNLTTPNEEIVLENGTYTEQVSINADGKYNVTIRSAEGADATIEAPDDIDDKSTAITEGIRPTLMVRHNDNVTIEDLTIDAGGNNEGVLVTDSHNLTVEDVTVTNARQGVRADYLGVDTRVKNVTVTDAQTGIMIYWLSENGLVANSTVTNATYGIVTDHLSDDTNVVDNDVSDAETGIVVNTDGGDVAGNTITNASTAINVPLSGSPAHIEDNEIENASVGIPMRQKLSLADTEVLNNTIDAETGLRLHGAYTQPEMVYNDLSGSDEVFDFPGYTSFDARLNYLGNRTADAAIAPPDTTYQPFLTEAPDDLDEGPEATTEIGVDLHLEGGKTYGVGVPGPSDTSIDEMFEEGFEGAVYGFDAASQSWTMLTGDDTVDSLNAMLVVAETDTRLTLDFQSPEDAPPAPGSYELQEGWNFVTAPAYTDAQDAYGNYVEDGQPVISSFEAPEGQVGPAGELEGTYMLGSGDAPNVSAFEGYFVFSSEDGSLMPTRFNADPTANELYEGLNVDESYSYGGADAEATSVEGLLAWADETDANVSAERLSEVAYGQFERALADADDPRTALSSTATEIAGEVDGERAGLVAAAMDDALQQIVDDEFAGEPEHDVMETFVEQLVSDAFPDESGDGRDAESNGTATESVSPPTAIAG